VRPARSDDTPPAADSSTSTAKQPELPDTATESRTPPASTRPLPRHTPQERTPTDLTPHANAFPTHSGLKVGAQSTSANRARRVRARPPLPASVEVLAQDLYRAMRAAGVEADLLVFEAIPAAACGVLPKMRNGRRTQLPHTAATVALRAQSRRFLRAHPP
jgi:hypothetical protein